MDITLMLKLKKLYFVLDYQKKGKGWIPWGVFKEPPEREKHQLPLKYKTLELYTDL